MNKKFIQENLENLSSHEIDIISYIVNNFLSKKELYHKRYDLQQRIDKVIECLNAGIVVPNSITKKELIKIINQRYSYLLSILKGENNE